MIKRIKKTGFTLIELLIVISIIGILAGLGTARYLTAERGARDAQRKSDLNQYRTALESYASANSSLYPVASGEVSSLCDLIKTDYLGGGCLNDVLAEEGVYSDYLYSSDGVDYVLAADLERSESNYYVVCSNGRSGEAGSLNGSTCPL